MHYLDGYITVIRLSDWQPRFENPSDVSIISNATEYSCWQRHAIIRTFCVFSVIVVIYVICVKHPHQFLRTVGILRETGPAAYL